MVSTSSTRETLRGAAPGVWIRGGWGEAVGAAAADLAAAAAADQAGLQGRARAASPGPPPVRRRIEAAAAQAQRRRGHRDHGATQQVGRGQPLDGLRHQPGDREQAAELQRGDKVAGDALVRQLKTRRGRGPVDPSQSAARRPQGGVRSGGKPPPRGRQERPQAAQSGGASRGGDSGGGSMGRSCGASGAQVARRRRRFGSAL